MLGLDNDPSLLVDVANDYNPANFDFYVINGNWEGTYTRGFITLKGVPSGDYSNLRKIDILCDNQDRLRGEYNEVFVNFDNENYVGPVSKYVPTEFDDDIPF